MTGHYNMYLQDLMRHNIFTSEFSVAATYSALSKLICSCAAPSSLFRVSPSFPARRSALILPWSCAGGACGCILCYGICTFYFHSILHGLYCTIHCKAAGENRESFLSFLHVQLPHPNPFPVPMLYYVVPFIVPWHVLLVYEFQNRMYGLYWWGLGTWIGAGLHGIVFLSGACTLGHTVSLLVSHSYPIHVPQSLSYVINYHWTFPC
jgi:hypothetical protein